MSSRPPGTTVLPDNQGQVVCCNHFQVFYELKTELRGQIALSILMVTVTGLPHQETEATATQQISRLQSNRTGKRQADDDDYSRTGQLMAISITNRLVHVSAC